MLYGRYKKTTNQGGLTNSVVSMSSNFTGICARACEAAQQKKEPLNFSSSGSMYNNLPTVFKILETSIFLEVYATK
jgi:hypothetical protein